MNLFADDYNATEDIPQWASDIVAGVRSGTVKAAESITDQYLHQITGTQQQNILAGYSNNDLLLFGALAYFALKG